jgi:hypothetical protein
MVQCFISWLQQQKSCAIIMITTLSNIEMLAVILLIQNLRNEILPDTKKIEI